MRDDDIYSEHLKLAEAASERYERERRESRDSIFSELAAALSVFGVVIMILACLRDGIARLVDRNSDRTTMVVNQNE